MTESGQGIVRINYTRNRDQLHETRKRTVNKQGRKFSNRFYNLLWSGLGRETPSRESGEGVEVSDLDKDPYI